MPTPRTTHLLAAALSLGLGTAAQAASVGGITVADNGFADSLTASAGSFTTAGGTLASVLTDQDAGTYAFSFSPGASVTLGFSNGISNGAGADLAIFELGIPDTIQVTINGTTLDVLLGATGFNAGGFALNAATIDLSDFGLAPGAAITSVVFGLSVESGSSTVPSFSLAAAINTGTTDVPEPMSLALLGSGLLGLAAFRRRQRAV